MKRFALLAAAIALLAGRPHASHAWSFDWAGHVEVDAAGLDSDDPTKRLDAVTELAKYDIALTQGHLMKALRDEDEKVQQAAAKALGQGGAIAAVPLMIEWLADSDIKKKQVAAGALGDIGGSDATAALIRTLGDPDSTVRAAAVKSLGTIGRRGNPSVVIALIPRLEDDPWQKPDVKLAAIGQLEELGDRRAVIPLVARFSDTSPAIRTAAVRAVGRMSDRSAVPALIRLISDPDEGVRTAAVGALGTLGAAEAIDALTEQLGTGSELFRNKVAYSLGQIAGTPGAGKPGEDAMRTLVANLAQPPQRQAAREALRVAGKAAVPALVAHLQGRLAGDPTTAVTLLQEVADARATATLAAELERGRVAMPIVLKALGATGDPQALVPVLRALGSKDPTIRLAAMESLRPLIGGDARAGDVLVEHLGDEDLEIRVLAAEYLGNLKVAAASAKLASLAGPGNPTRLRRAAIDALGEIGRPDATKPLLAVLREGPAELHDSAATALSYIGDPSAIGPLIQQAQSDRGPTRHEVVRALGATLRGHDDAGARKVLRELEQDGSVKVALAAIAGLAAAKNAGDAPFLRSLVEDAASDRRRAAAWALGEMHDTGGVEVLAQALAARDDRLVGDAAWALGEILATSPKDSHVPAVVDRLLFTAKHAGWAGAIDATGALARILWAQPAGSKGGRGELLSSGTRRATLVSLVFHKSRLVRINVAHALASLGPDDDVQKALAQLLHDDPSPHVRIAAARGLARIGGARSAAALKSAADNDADAEVKDAAKSAPPPIAPRDEWRTYPVVDPSADDAPVRQEQYFIHTLDGVVWATSTDARGHITSEHMPHDEGVKQAGSHEIEY